MYKKLFIVVALLGAVAVWLGFVKNKISDEEWNGTVVGKREALNGPSSEQGQLLHLLEVELEDGEVAEIEVSADLFSTIEIGDRVTRSANDAIPFTVEAG